MPERREVTIGACALTWRTTVDDEWPDGSRLETVEARSTRIENRSVGLAVRAPRVAILIREDADWEMCLSLVQTLTETWGGATFAIIPTDGRRILKEFWRLLHLHDPDWFAKFGDVPLCDRLEQQLLSRHSVFLPEHDRVEQIWPGSVGYPLASVSSARQDGLTIGKVVAPSVGADPVSQLVVYSSAGRLSGDEIQQLWENHVQITEEPIEPTIAGLLGLSGRLWAPSRSDSPTQYPISLASMGLGVYSNPRDMRQSPVVFVCGQTVADFSYFWTLRSISGLPPHAPVFWLPRIDPEPGSHPEAAALWRCQANALASRCRDHGNRPWVATSLSMELENLATLGDALIAGRLTQIGSDPDLLNVSVVSPLDTWSLAPVRAEIWDSENPPFANPSAVQFIDGEATIQLPTPILDGVSKSIDTKVHWYVDVVMEGFGWPSRPGLTDLLIRQDRLSSSRVTRIGLSYAAVPAFQLGGVPARTLVARPRLALPDDLDLFSGLLGSAGLNLTRSDVGRSEVELMRLADGLVSIGAMLRHTCECDALRRFYRPRPNQRGVRDQGTTIRNVGYLDLAALEAVLGGRDAAVKWTDRWLISGLLHRGLLIKCATCLHFDWYGLGELERRFMCHLCGRLQDFSSESPIAFRLDPVARKALEENSHVSLLALDFLRHGSKRGFHFVGGSNIRRDGQDLPESNPWLEVDFIVAVDGRLVLGECKSKSTLSSEDRAQLNKYKRLCHILRPDQFYVCTDAAAWSPGDRQYLEGLGRDLSTVDVELVTPTGSDLGWSVAQVASGSNTSGRRS